MAARWRTTLHPSQPWVATARGVGRRTATNGEVRDDREGDKRGDGGPATHPPPPQEFYHRVEQVPIAISPPAGMNDGDNEWGGMKKRWQ